MKRSNILTLLLVLTAFIFGACTPTPDRAALPTVMADLEDNLEAEHIRDLIIAHVTETHPDTADLLANTKMDRLPALSTTMIETLQYGNDDWIMTIIVLPANLFTIDDKLVTEDTYDVELLYHNLPPFIQWSGRYGENAGLIETNFVNREQAIDRIPPEAARDAAFNYMQQNHEEITSILAPWTSSGMVEDLGNITYSYQANDWEITVVWDEYEGFYTILGFYTEKGEDTYIEINWEVRIDPDGKELKEIDYTYFGGV